MISRVVVACALALGVISPVFASECVRDNYGTVYCGRGDCLMDSNGKLHCAKRGGGAITTYEVTVRRDLSSLIGQMKQLFPGEPVSVVGSGKDVVLSGTVSSKYVIDKALSIITNFTVPAGMTVHGDVRAQAASRAAGSMACRRSRSPSRR